MSIFDEAISVIRKRFANDSDMDVHYDILCGSIAAIAEYARRSGENLRTDPKLMWALYQGAFDISGDPRFEKAAQRWWRKIH